MYFARLPFADEGVGDRSMSDAPRISGRKKPWRDECGGIVGSPYFKWAPRNHGPTWELRRENQLGHYVSPVRLPIEATGAQLYNCPYHPSPWTDRIIASTIEDPAQKDNHTLPPGQSTSLGCAAESGLCIPAPRTAKGEYIVPTDHMGSYRKCTGRDISGCQRIWRK